MMAALRVLWSVLAVHILENYAYICTKRKYQQTGGAEPNRDNGGLLEKRD